MSADQVTVANYNKRTWFWQIASCRITKKISKFILSWLIVLFLDVFTVLI